MALGAGEGAGICGACWAGIFGRFGVADCAEGGEEGVGHYFEGASVGLVLGGEDVGF